MTAPVNMPHGLCRARLQRSISVPRKGAIMDRRGGGWVAFAAIVLGVAGIMRVFDAIWAFRYRGALSARTAQNWYSRPLDQVAAALGVRCQARAGDRPP